MLSLNWSTAIRTESQVAAAVITLAAMLLLYFMNGLSSFVSTEASASLIALMVLVVIFAVILQLLAKNYYVSILAALFDRFDPFVAGVFDLTAIVYYLSIICVFLFLTVQSMEKRRWNE